MSVEQPQRFAGVSRVSGEGGYRKYKAFHAQPFEGVNEMIKSCHLQNYSIYYYDGLLFSYYEYTGDDYESDMEKMATDSRTQQWWAAVDPCMNPFNLNGRPWADMEELYHLD